MLTTQTGANNAETFRRSLRFYPLNPQVIDVIHNSFPHGGKVVITEVDERWKRVEKLASSLLWRGILRARVPVDKWHPKCCTGRICTAVDDCRVVLSPGEVEMVKQLRGISGIPSTIPRGALRQPQPPQTVPHQPRHSSQRSLESRGKKREELDLLPPLFYSCAVVCVHRLPRIVAIPPCTKKRTVPIPREGTNRKNQGDKV